MAKTVRTFRVPHPIAIDLGSALEVQLTVSIERKQEVVVELDGASDLVSAIVPSQSEKLITIGTNADDPRYKPGNVMIVTKPFGPLTIEKGVVHTSTNPEKPIASLHLTVPYGSKLSF